MSNILLVDVVLLGGLNLLEEKANKNAPNSSFDSVSYDIFLDVRAEGTENSDHNRQWVVQLHVLLKSNSYNGSS
eukprot:JP435856.1.p6 GENE.JP435856.1~~JP435856.1.p6  ORF type:complete len:74 (+),score=11.29 JP435856.1:1027-1248(+)